MSSITLSPLQRPLPPLGAAYEACPPSGGGGLAASLLAVRATGCPFAPREATSGASAASGAAEDASCDPTCVVCLETLTGAAVVCAERHSLCVSCIPGVIERLPPEALAAAGGVRLPCPVDGCASAPHDSTALYGADAVVRVARQAAALAAREHDAELTAALISATAFELELAERVRLLRAVIVERDLALHCPRCASPFAEYDGCNALSCSKCGAGFCGLCLVDCGANAHAHYYTTHGKNIFDRRLFESTHRAGRIARIAATVNDLLASSGAELARALVDDLARADLRDLQITAATVWDAVEGRAVPEVSRDSDAVGEGVSPLDEVKRAAAALSAAIDVTRVPDAVTAADDLDTKFAAIREFRRLLANSREAYVDAVIQLGLAPRLVDLLNKTPFSDRFRREVCSCIGAIAAGASDQTIAIIEAGAVPAVVGAAAHGFEAGPDCADAVALCETAMWSLGNIAGEDSDVAQEAIRSLSVATVVGKCLSTSARNTSVARTAAWAASNLARSISVETEAEQHEVLLASVASFIRGSTDAEALSEALWALGSLAKGSDESGVCAAVVDSGVVPRVVELVAHDLSVVSLPALRVVGYCAAGDVVATQSVVDAGVLAALPRHLDINTESCREATWIISNMCAGTAAQARAVVDTPHLLKGVVAILLHSEDARSLKEAAWAVANALTHDDDYVTERLLEFRAHEALLTKLSRFSAAKRNDRHDIEKALSRAIVVMLNYLSYGAPGGITFKSGAIFDAARELRDMREALRDWAGGANILRTHDSHVLLHAPACAQLAEDVVAV